MKKLTALLIAATLTGCGTTSGFVSKEVVVQYQYVTRTATDQQKQIPQYSLTINPRTASQLELAEWIKQTEERQWALESIITELIKFYEKPVTAQEATTLPAPKSATPEAREFIKIGR